MISLNSLSSILQTLQSDDAKSIKPLVQLLQLEVLDSLGKENYLLKIGDKQLIALSKQPLQKGEHYYAKLIEHTKTKPILSHLLKIPNILTRSESLLEYASHYDLKTLENILKSKTSIESFKTELLHKLASSKTKEQFGLYSHLLLSLHQNVLTFALFFYEQLLFLQIKKRHDKRKRKDFLDFYAFFSRLGPVSGILDEYSAHLNVAYEEVATFLQAHQESLPLHVSIEVIERIEPLFEASNKGILDITT